ncbi:hypothetical protein [Amycolatopsis sp. cmx-4-54]|uniref:SPW repeat domain-containing protein n=1 Tax=Amycolatopsis sp. cmx-4-54 TaxID=2790936 RepID=UPI00397B9FF8
MKTHTGTSLGFAIIDALTFLTGLWLVLSPFSLDHGHTGGGFNGYWNDGLTGCALILLGTHGIVAPSNGRRFAFLRAALGGWLIAAPMVLGYNSGISAPQVTSSDIVSGIVVLLLWLATATHHRRPPRSWKS